MPHDQQTVVKNGLNSVSTWLSWGTSFALKAGYSAYHYTKKILRYEQQQIQCEESKVKHALSSTEQDIAKTLSNTLKEVAVSVILSSGASWLTIAYVTWGMLPKDTVVKFGTTLFGSYFPTVIDVQHLTGSSLTVMNGFVPISWLQIGCKKGIDATVHLVGSEQLLQFYKNYHVGERIWLWTGVAGSVHHDLKIISPEFIQTEVTEYRTPEVVSTVTDTSQCRPKWLFWEECHLKERKIMEQSVLTQTIRSGILRGRSDGELEPVSYEEVSDTRNYNAIYENGHLIREVTIRHLPKPINTVSHLSERTNISAFIIGNAVTLVEAIPPLALLFLVQRVCFQRSTGVSLGVVSFWHSTQFVTSVVAGENKQEFQDFLTALTGAYINRIAGMNGDLLKKLNLQTMASDYQAAYLNLMQYENENLKRQARLDDASTAIINAVSKLVLNKDIFKDSNLEDVFSVLEISYPISAVMIYVLYKKAIRNNDIGEFKNMKEYMKKYGQFSNQAIQRIDAIAGFHHCSEARKKYPSNSILSPFSKRINEFEVLSKIASNLADNTRDSRENVKSTLNFLNPKQSTTSSFIFKMDCQKARNAGYEHHDHWKQATNERKREFCELIYSDNLPSADALINKINEYLDTSCVSENDGNFFPWFYGDKFDKWYKFIETSNAHINKIENFYIEIYNKYISLGTKPSVVQMSIAMQMMENGKTLPEICHGIEVELTPSHKLEL